MQTREERKGEPGKRKVRDSPHKRLECDTLVSSTHIKVMMGCGDEAQSYARPVRPVFGSSRDGGGAGKAFVCRFV